MDNYSKKSSWNKTGAGNKLTDLGSEVLKSRVPRIMMIIIIIHICKFICRTMQKYPFLKTKFKSSQWSPRWPIVISKSPTAPTEHLPLSGQEFLLSCSFSPLFRLVLYVPADSDPDLYCILVDGPFFATRKSGRGRKHGNGIPCCGGHGLLS